MKGWLIFEPFKDFYSGGAELSLLLVSSQICAISGPLKQPVGEFEVKLGFLKRIKKRLPPSTCKVIVQSNLIFVVDYGDFLYSHVAPSKLHQLNAMDHSALRLITNTQFHTHHCPLYLMIGWSLLQKGRRGSHVKIFIYKALMLR